MSMGKGGKAPKAPNPDAVASAESRYNRPTTFNSDGSQVLQGYIDQAGQFQAGPVQPNTQAATKAVESPYQQMIRAMTEPAAADMLGSVLPARTAMTRSIMPGMSDLVSALMPAGNAMAQTAIPAASDITKRIIAESGASGMPGPARVQDRSDVANAIFGRNMSMMQPAIDKSQTRLLTNLQARGLPIGSEAFNDAYGEQVRQTQDTISRLAQDATITAGQEQTRQFGLDSEARNNAMREITGALNGQFWNPASLASGATTSASLLAGSPDPAAIMAGVPGAMQPGSTTPVDYSGAVGNQYQSQLAKYQADQGQAASTKGLMGTLGAAAIMSSREFKEVVGGVDPVAVWQALQAMPVQAWTYKPEIAPTDRATHIGPMAEDFQRATGLGDGKSISVTDMLGLLLSALQSAMVRIEWLEALAQVNQRLAEGDDTQFEAVVH